MLIPLSSPLCYSSVFYSIIVQFKWHQLFIQVTLLSYYSAALTSIADGIIFKAEVSAVVASNHGVS